MAKPARDGAGPRRQPRQSRSIETYQSILDAAVELFAASGYEQTTTHQIAGRAGISVGALYRYFADKQAIVTELYRQEVSDMRNRVLATFNLSDIITQDIPELVRKTVALAFKLSSERPGLRKVLNEQSRKIPELVDLRRSHERDVHQTVRQILTAAPGVRLPDIEAGAYLITLFIDSLIEDHIQHRRDQVELDDERLIDAAVDFVVRYALGRVD